MNKLTVNIKCHWCGMKCVIKIEVAPKESVRHIIGKVLQELQEIATPNEYYENEYSCGIWLLGVKEKNGEEEILDNKQCLLDYGIQNGDFLQLIFSPIAGDGYGLSYYLEQPIYEKSNYSEPTYCSNPEPSDTIISYYPTLSTRKKTFGEIIRSWITNKEEVYSSIFAPAELRRKSYMQVQVYLHLYEEAENVWPLAQESDKNAERRVFIPLQCKLKKGNRVDVLLNIYGETLLMSDKKSVIWQGTFTKCSFVYFVPNDIDVDELSCMASLTVNDIPVGEMRFLTKIVEHPRQLNPEIIAHKYSKVFISYSHKDESKVKFLHEGLELGGIQHFFDRKYLKTGDVFPQVIQDYINSADLFVLCWSENAAQSEYVKKERLQALKLAFPQVKPPQAAKLSIYPISIEPRAELPSDMKDNYHFGIL